MIVGSINLEIQKLLQSLNGLEGYVISTRDGIPLILDLGGVSYEKNALLSTMFATAIGSAHIIEDILYGESADEFSHICLSYSSNYVIIMATPKTSILISIILYNKPDNETAIINKLKEIASIIDKNPQVLF